MSIRTGRWTELGAEQGIRCTGNERFLVFMMSMSSGVPEGLYGLVVGESGQRSGRISRRHNRVGVSTVS